MTPSESLNEIKTGNCYQDFPELYDFLYLRFLKTIPTFVDLVSANTPKRGKVLEIAAGTGQVSIRLLQMGFDLTCLDANESMLKILKEKVEKENFQPRIIVGDFLNTDLADSFDTICIRQAVNYFLGLDDLVLAFRKIAELLKPEGFLIFNAPNYQPENQEYPTVENRYDLDNLHAFVLEQNYLHNKTITHLQKAIIWGDKNLFISDKNSFYLFTKAEFEDALKKAGFNLIEFFGSNVKPYTDESKTLYCKAKK